MERKWHEKGDEKECMTELKDRQPIRPLVLVPLIKFGCMRLNSSQPKPLVLECLEVAKR